MSRKDYAVLAAIVVAAAILLYYLLQTPKYP
jgi:uncharacterized protein involved in exopolysaccharide biosynthesis